MNFNFDKFIKKTNKALTKFSEEANKVLTKATDEVKNIFDPPKNNSRANNTNIPRSNLDINQQRMPSYNYCHGQSTNNTNINNSQPLFNYPSFEPIVNNINQIQGNEIPHNKSPIDEDNFDDLIRFIRKATNPEVQIVELNKAVSVNTFTSKQARKIMKKITIPFYQIKASLILYPSLMDMENYFKMVDVCKDQVKKEIYSQLQTQFNACPVESQANINPDMTSSISSSMYYSNPNIYGPPIGISQNPYRDYYCPPREEGILNNNELQNDFSILENTYQPNKNNNFPNNNTSFSQGDFAALKKRVEQTGFSDRKLEEIKLSLTKSYITASQASELVRLIPFDEYQYKLCLFLKDKLYDPQNISIMIDGCNFPSTKAKLRKEIM